MEYIIVFLILFLLIFLVLYIFGYRMPKKNESLAENKALRYITLSNNMKLNKEKIEKLSKIIVFANSLMLSSTLTIMWFLKVSIFIKMIISFVIFIIEILIIYNLIGYILKKKGW